MDLTEKSASDIERIKHYRELAVRFFKELNLLASWKKYIASESYMVFCKAYQRRYGFGLEEWYNRKYLYEILGRCNFTSYLAKNHIKIFNQCAKDYEIYDIFLCFIAIFDIDEYIEYAKRFGESEDPNIFIDVCLKDYEKTLIYNDFKNIVDNWRLIKDKTKYGNKNND